MSTHWCYTRDGRTTFGPVTWQDLMRMASTDELLRSDVIGQIGMARSIRAGSVPGLFAACGEPGRLAETIGKGVHVVGVRYSS